MDPYKTGCAPVEPTLTVMATVLLDAFLRRTLFLLESWVDIIQTCAQCLPSMNVGLYDVIQVEQDVIFHELSVMPVNDYYLWPPIPGIRAG